MERKRDLKFPLGILSVVALFVVAGFGTMSCRNHLIDDCREKGGQPLVPSIFSEDPADVRCVLPAGPVRSEGREE